MIDTLRVVDLTQQDGGHVNAIGDHFDIEVFERKHAFHNTYFLKFTILAQHAHGIREMRSETNAGFVSAEHIFPVAVRVCDRGNAIVLYAAFEELFCAGQFGSSIPTLNATRGSENALIFLRIGVANDIGHLGTGLFQVEIGSFEVQTHDGASGFCHQFLASLDRFVYPLAIARRERGEDGRCAVLHVGVYRRAESFFRTFHEVATTTAVNVQLNTTGHDVASFSVDLLRPFNRQGIVRNG